MERRRLRFVPLIAAIVAGSPAAGMAKERGLDWLMNEPVTLFDLGILQLRQDLEQVSRWLVDSGYTAEEPLSGAYYEWRQGLIVAYVTLRERTRDPTAMACRDAFGRIARRLTRDVPQGSRRAQIYLESLFLHQGPGNRAPSRTVGAELAEIVQVEVTLLPPPPVFLGGAGVRCFGKLDTDPAEANMIVTN